MYTKIYIKRRFLKIYTKYTKFRKINYIRKHDNIHKNLDDIQI